MDRIETTILRNLIFDEEYSRKVIPFIQPDYFENKTEKIIFEEATQFIVKYDAAITVEALNIEPSILPNPSPSNQSPQNPILYFLLTCKDNGTAMPEGWEALHFIIEIFSSKFNLFTKELSSKILLKFAIISCLKTSSSFALK